MDIFTNLHSDFYCDSNLLKVVRSCFYCQNVFNKTSFHSLESFIGAVNSGLTSHKKRTKFASVLLMSLPNLPESLIKENTEKWVKLIVQDVKYASFQSQPLLLKLLNEIFTVANVNELNVSLPSSLQHCVISYCISGIHLCGFMAFECLYQFLLAYPGSASYAKKSALSAVLQTLDTVVDNEELVLAAAKVYSLLFPSVNYQSKSDACFGEYIELLVNEVHKNLDYLFCDIIENEEFTVTTEESLPFPFLDLENVSKSEEFLRVSLRLHNLFLFINQIISMPSKKVLRLSPYRLLSCVLRVIKITNERIKLYKGEEFRTLQYLFPFIQHCALGLLDGLLYSIGDSLDLFWFVIQDALVILLKSLCIGDSENSVGVNFYIKSMIYDTLSSLCNVSRGRHTLPLWVAEELLKDIIPKDANIILQDKNSNLKKVSMQRRKGKKRGYSVSVNASFETVASANQKLLNSGVILESALGFIKVICVNITFWKDKKFMQVIQNGLLKASLYITSGTITASGYRSWQSRQKLCLCLLSLATVCTASCQPIPYAYLMHVFKLGSCDPSSEVATTCQTAVTFLSFIMMNPQISSYNKAALQLKNITRNVEDSEDSDSVCSSTNDYVSSTNFETSNEIICMKNNGSVNCEENVENSVNEAEENAVEMVADSHDVKSLNYTREEKSINLEEAQQSLNSLKNVITNECESLNASQSKRNSSMSSHMTKKLKITDDASLEEILETFVDSGPDSD